MKEETLTIAVIGNGGSKQLVVGRTVHDQSFRGCDMRQARLAGLRCDAVDLAAANLSQADLTNARLSSCRLRSASLSGANLQGATLRLCNLDAVIAVDCSFSNARVEDSSLVGADLTQARLDAAHVSETSFNRACLRDCSLRDAEGAGVGFRGADMGGAQLQGAVLQDADFRGADLTDANLAGGDFRYADFRGAILEGVCWDDVILTNARFDSCVGVGAGTAPAPDKRKPNHAAPGKAEAVSGALEQVIRRAIQTASAGTVQLDREFADLSQAYSEWQASGIGSDEERLQQLVASLQTRLDESSPALGDALQPLAQMLKSLHAELPADDVPDKMWKGVIREVLGADSSDEDAVEKLAQRMQQILKGS